MTQKMTSERIKVQNKGLENNLKSLKELKKTKKLKEKELEKEKESCLLIEKVWRIQMLSFLAQTVLQGLCLGSTIARPSFTVSLKK